MEKVNKPLSDEKRAETFNVGDLIGKSWDDINYIISKNKQNGFIMQKIANHQEFKDYCKQQAERFLDYKIALRDRDVKAANILWFYGDLELEDIHKIQERIEKNDYLSSDKFRDLAEDKTLKLFAGHVEEIQEEMEMPVKGSDFIRRHERQKLVDYIRFMEGGNKSKEMFEKGDWKFFQNEYNNFPKMRTPFIIELYKKAEEKNSNTDRLKLMGRILFYRFDDINSGRRKLTDEEEMTALEQFIDSDTQVDTAAKVLEAVKAAREEKAARLKEKEEKRKAKEAADAEKKTAQNGTADEENNGDNAAALTAEAAQPATKETKSKGVPFVVDEFLSDNTPVKEKKDEKAAASDDAEKVTAPLTPPAEKPAADKKENKDTEAPEKDEKDKPEQTTSEAVEKDKPKETDKEEDKEPENWRKDTFNEWYSWGRAHHKWVKSYQDESNKNGLSINIFANHDAYNKGDFEAQIIYRKHNHITVKGKDGKVPGNDVFDGIIATAKSGSKQISFGNIKSDEFKARLMLACLIEPEIEMINAPKIEDLKNVPEELIEALKNPAKRKAEIANQKRENLDRQKNGSERKPYRKEGGKPRREYSDEEKAAYRARQAKKSAEM